MLTEVWVTLGIWLPGVSIMLVLTGFSAFFSGSETALFSLTRDDLQTFRNGTIPEKQAVTLLGNSTRVLTAILFWNLIVNLSYFAVSVVVARKLIVGGYPEGAWIFSLLGVVFIILFGEVLPKSLAVVFPRAVSRVVSFPLLVSVNLLDRLIPKLLMITRGLQRGFWPKLEEEAILDVDDLEKAIDLSSQSNEMISHERNILHHILELNEVTAEELMRPRGTYVTVTEPVRWKDLGPSSIPGGFAAIVEAGSDHVVGVYWLNGTLYNPKKGLKSFRQSVIHVPWCAHAAYILNQMRKKLCHTAVVVDEYGHTLGIISQQDLLDTVFSTSPSRARLILKREAILKVGEYVYHLDGLTTLRFLAQHLHLPFDGADEPSVTVVGLLHQHLRRFPEVGDECDWQNWKLRVIDVSGPSRIRVLMEQQVQVSDQPEYTP